MEVWQHGAAVVYHPFDERRVDIDGGATAVRPAGANPNSYPHAADLWFNFESPLLPADAPAQGWALDAVLVRIRTFKGSGTVDTGITWVNANDRERGLMRTTRDEPLTSPDRFRILRFPAPRPSSPYAIDYSSIGGPVNVRLRIEGPSLALVAAVGVALRPSWSYTGSPGNPGRRAGMSMSTPMSEQVVIDPEMSAADYREAIDESWMLDRPQRALPDVTPAAP